LHAFNPLKAKINQHHVQMFRTDYAVSSTVCLSYTNGSVNAVQGSNRCLL